MITKKIVLLALGFKILLLPLACNSDQNKSSNTAPASSTPSTAEDTAFKGFEDVSVVKIAIKNTSEYCTGTLVAEDVVITARHCFFDDKTGAKQEPVSVSLREKNGNFSKPYSVASYRTTPNVLDYEDIAVIKLTEKIANASPIKIAERANEAVSLPTGTEVYAFGFTSNSWSKRQVTALDPAGSGIALNILSKWVIPTNAQPKMEGGDSGGPLVIKQDGKWLLLGALQGVKPYSLEIAAITFNAVQAFMPEITALLGAPLPVERLK